MSWAVVVPVAKRYYFLRIYLGCSRLVRRQMIDADTLTVLYHRHYSTVLSKVNTPT